MSQQGQTLSSSKVNVGKKFPKVFRDLGSFSKELTIHTREGAKPFALSVPRSVALPLLPKLKKELDALQNKSVIVPVGFPTEWCSPTVIVSKLNGNTHMRRLYGSQ